MKSYKVRIRENQLNKQKTKWTNLSVPLGNIEIAQERRAAYDAAALAADKKVSTWAREQLDLAAQFKEKEIPL